MKNSDTKYSLNQLQLRNFTMLCIQDVVQQAIATGYLTLEAENQLRYILQNSQYDATEINAFANLQVATMSEEVPQESREILSSQSMSASLN